MILLLLGPDAYRKRQRRLAAIAEFGVPTDEIVRIEGETTTIQALDDSLMSLGLFATKKVVLIPAVGELPKTVASRLMALTSRVGEDTLLILEADKLDQRTELAKALKKLPTETFEFLQGSSLDRWITDQAKSLGVTIEPEARRLLIERAGNDSWRLHSELLKLSTAVLGSSVIPDRMPDDSSGNQDPESIQPRHGSRIKSGMTNQNANSLSTITLSHVKDLTLATTSPTLFALTDALTAGQPAKARIALAKLLAGGEAPLGILGMLGYHLRTLVLVKDATETHIPAKLHPFVVQKHQPLTQRIGWPQLTAWYAHLAEYDSAAKTGTMEPIVALELMVHELSALTH